MIHGRTAELAKHVYLRWRRAVGWIGCEDHIPLSVKVVDLGSPELRRVGHAGRWLEQEFRLGIVPVAVRLSVFIAGNLGTAT